MKATYVPPQRTPFTPLELAQAYELALGGDGKVHAPLIAVLMAHCALETGRDLAKGQIGPSCWNYNLGNVKAGPTYEGLFTCITLNEYLARNGIRKLIWFSPEGELAHKGGPVVGLRYDVPPGHPQTRMRAHASLEEGVRAKLRFLHAPRFTPALAAAGRGDAAGYVTEIHRQKYFTADLVPYRNAVVSLSKTYLPVAQRIADTPLKLTSSEEMEIAANIGRTIRVVPFELDPGWAAMRAERDSALKES